MPQNFHLDHYTIGVPFIFLSVSLVVLTQTIFRYYMGEERIKKTHEIAGQYLALVGTFYAVLLGLVVFDAMSKFQEAEKTIEDEAKSMLTVYSLSEQFPNQASYIKAHVQEYTDEVVEHELKLMENGELSEKARNTILSLVSVVKTIAPVDENQQAVYPILLQEMIKWWEFRRDRIREAMFGIPTAEWIVLILGALITISFTCFFTTESIGAHLAMRFLASTLIAMSLYLVLLFGSPFSGDMRVSDKPFKFVQMAMNVYLKNLATPK